jgi:hypothetical protein
MKERTMSNIEFPEFVNSLYLFYRHQLTQRGDSPLLFPQFVVELVRFGAVEFFKQQGLKLDYKQKLEAGIVEKRKGTSETKYDADFCKRIHDDFHAEMHVTNQRKKAAARNVIDKLYRDGIKTWNGKEWAEDKILRIVEEYEESM